MVREAAGIVLAAVLLGGCSGYSCRGPQLYESARSVPPLEVPEDLTEPENDSRLVIPRAADDAPRRTADGPCLDQPPDFAQEDRNS
ncbi:hypothetical protein BH24PSE2_BH24PSE2_00730 [soil metagenome]